MRPSEWNSQAADLAEEADKLRTAANRYATALTTFPTNPQLSPTIASHIFPESIDVNLNVKNKMSIGSIYASSLVLTRCLSSLRRSMLREYGL